uniref:Major capsid protein N-terminal domain-containing protein n=1 Tax=viral metagenome TaxID=1070528 RepID=A0A6C0IY37_9ZZZZ
MGLGYFQLTVASDEDKYLVGNPQFTYFKSVHKRHTNFSLQNVSLNFSGETYMGKHSNFSKKIYTNIPKNGDLIHRMYLMINLDFDGAQKELIESIGVSGFSLIDYIEISIGGQIIDKHTGDWLHIYHEHFLDSSKNDLLCDMINIHNVAKYKSSLRDGILYLPLAFWFNKDPGVSLPIIALNNNEVKINVKFNPRNKINNKVNNLLIIQNVELLVEYIHLDVEEKRLFVNNSHQYLIEQIQYSDLNNLPLKLNEFDEDSDYEKYNHKINVPFKNPIKELFWCIQDLNYNNKVNKGNNLFNFWLNLNSEERTSQLIDAKIMINGKEIFEPKSYNYFLSVLKYQYHSGNNYTNIDVLTEPKIIYSEGSGVYCYSFSLKPEEFQPSGSLNFSKLDNVELNIRVKRDKNGSNQKIIKLFAINYNILNIISGQAGLIF